MYDTIIIGRDLSSLVAALASCRQGFKTLLLTEGPSDLDHQEGGYTFSIDPKPFSGFGHEQTVLRILNELHPAPGEAPPLLPMDPAFQVIMPGHRIELFRDTRKLIEEMVREYPSEAKEIQRFYRAVHKAGTFVEHWVEKDLYSDYNGLSTFIRDLLRFPTMLACRSSLVIRKTGKQAAFRKAIEAQFALLSHLERRASSFPVSAAYLFSLPARGIFYPVGGRSAWMAWLRQGFVTAGGMLIDDCSVMRIDTKPEIVVDIERSGEPLSLRARKLGLSTQWEKMNLLLLQQKFFRRLVRRLNGIPTHAYPFCLHMGVHEGGLPERLAPFCVVVPDERKEARRPGPVFLKTSLHGETDLAPAGRRTLSATVYLKDSPLVLADIQLKEVAKSIMDSLEEFLPFLRDSIDYIHVERSIALTRQYQDVISHQYLAPKRAWLALNTLSPATPLPDVFLTGGILRAGLGFEGEVLSGLDAALWAGRKEQSNG